MHRCEHLLAPSLDENQALQLLLWGQRLHCRRLCEFCVSYLADTHGAWAQQRSAPPPPLEALPGFEMLDLETVQELETALGGPRAIYADSRQSRGAIP